MDRTAGLAGAWILSTSKAWQWMDLRHVGLTQWASIDCQQDPPHLIIVQAGHNSVGHSGHQVEIALEIDAEAIIDAVNASYRKGPAILSCLHPSPMSIRQCSAICSHCQLAVGDCGNTVAVDLLWGRRIQRLSQGGGVSALVECLFDSVRQHFSREGCIQHSHNLRHAVAAWQNLFYGRAMERKARQKKETNFRFLRPHQ